MRRQQVVDLAFGGLVWLFASVRGCRRCASLLAAVLVCVAEASLELPGSGAGAGVIGIVSAAHATVPGEAAATDVMRSAGSEIAARTSAFDAEPHAVSVDPMRAHADRSLLLGNHVDARIARLDPDTVDPQPGTERATRRADEDERASGERPSGERASARGASAPDEASGAAGLAESIVARRTTEPRNIARFISKRYRVELEDTREIVYHAYHAAREFEVDPLLVLAIVSVESSFRAEARSPKGAHGLMQVHTRVHREKFEPYGGVRAAFDPRVNLRVGTRILREYIERGGDIKTGLKFYVGAAFLKHDFGYARKVLAARARIAAAARGAQPDTAEARAELESGRASPTSS
ncbi:MAG: transglycosylase SLT domain-containing protein [Burkholderiales bacterium]|nr:MAG: transglycosylase SLT domain-containing protein [Burkholderiales bacterium]